MYAQLDETDNLVGSKPIAVYRRPQAITLPNGDQLPRNWMSLFSQAEMQAMHIWPLVENVIDTKVERPSGEPTYVFDSVNVNATTPTQDLTLDGYRAVKMRELDTAYSQEIATPVIINLGGTDYAFSTDEKPKQLMFHVRTAVNSGMAFPVNFKWSSIAYETYPQVVSVVTEIQFNQIVVAVLTQDYSANKQFVELREQVENATSRAEVDAIVWV